MIAAQKFGFLNPVHTTNYLPKISADACVGCGKCVEVYPVSAIELVPGNSMEEGAKKSARLNEDTCLGCGVCVRNCPADAMELRLRKERVITPSIPRTRPF